jgi:2-polyprenyl-6-methoxyphenol hydroxylase-like FAD-dependent oxidoreductase
MERQPDEKMPAILVIGGGIAGLTTALALQRAGLQVRVFEQADTNREEGAGVSLWSNATQVLSQLGLRDLLHEVGAPITRIVRYTYTGRMLTEVSMEGITNALGIGSFAVHRAEFHEGLFQALAPETVSFQARCTQVQQHEDGFVVQFADGRTAQGDVLIGADGIHSTIATHLFSQRALRYAGYTTIRAITSSFDHPFLPPGKLFQTWGPGGLFGAVRLTRGRVYWYLQLDSPAGSPRRAKAELLALCHGWHEPIEALIEATEENSLLQRDVYDCKPLPSWGKGGITLVGDAAHPMTTTLGQGACQAIEDAGVLGSYMRTTSHIQALRAYEQARMQRATMVANISLVTGKIEQWDLPPLSWVRELLLVRPPQALQERLMRPVFGYGGPL